ncbi:hypothetical protein [Actinomadura violacea]|uniref:Uncharacterized protein n=1 Tax=Actinomadura violacea TaxID=2819934 RepID=A0ABS3RXH5_9ACTN|nr:hypothetical protein [Actinomadura violacea]MBO2461458.1 hypothetical protein [Actinomadura violacea]
MQIPGSGYVVRPEGLPFETEVDQMVRMLVEGAAQDGIAPSEVELMTNVTEMPDDQVAVLGTTMRAAGVSITLIDDGPTPRAGTVRSCEMEPHELAVIDQATAASREGDSRVQNDR